MRWSVLPVTAALAVLLVVAAVGPLVAAPGNGGIMGTQGPQRVAEGKTDSQRRDVSDRVALRVALLGMAIDVQPGYVRISEVVHLQNDTSQTFLGNLTFPLPRGARFITFHEGLHRPVVEGDRIVDRLIIRPGSHQATYAYTLAGEGEIVLDRQIPLPVERLELFTTAPAEVRSPRLQPAPTVTEEGRAYTRASGRNVPAGPLPMTVVGVPTVRLWPAPAAAGMLAGLLALGLGWAVLSSRREDTVRRSR